MDSGSGRFQDKNSRRLSAAGPAQGRQLFRAGRKSCGRGIPWGIAGGPRGGAGPGAPGSQLGSPGQHVGFSGVRPQNARGGPGSGGAAPGAVRKSAGGGAQTAPLRLPSRPPPRAGATSVRPWPRSAGLAAPVPAGGGGGGGGGRGKGGPGRNPRGFPRRLPGVFVWESSTSPFTAGSRRTARRGTWQSLAGHFLDRMGPPPAPCAPGKGGAPPSKPCPLERGTRSEFPATRKERVPFHGASKTTKKEAELRQQARAASWGAVRGARYIGPERHRVVTAGAPSLRALPPLLLAFRRAFCEPAHIIFLWRARRPPRHGDDGPHRGRGRRAPGGCD